MVSTMSLTEQTAQPSPQVLFVGEKETKRLLETYVKRSLSLNDGAKLPRRRERRTRKWVNLAEQNKRDRKHSSDTSLNSLHSEDYLSVDNTFSEAETGKKPQATQKDHENKSKLWKKRGPFGSDGKPKKGFLHFDKEKRGSKQLKKACEEAAGNIRHDEIAERPSNDQLESSTEAKKPKESKKKKKSSIWKSILGWFSRGNSDKQEEQEDAHVRTEETISHLSPSVQSTSCLPFPDVLSSSNAVILRHKSPNRRHSLKKLSIKRQSKDMGIEKTPRRPCTLDLPTDTQDLIVKSIEEVEPTSSYYEKMSEELEKIVHEVKNSPLEDNRTFPGTNQPTDINCLSISQEEAVERIVDLIMQQGDVIDSKLKENPTINSYFSMLSYGSFQKLADQYVRCELPQQKNHTPVAAPELVKFAFTLDFTARVAGLSRHAPGHILGFGNQYLKDRFTHTSKSHPHISNITSEDQKTSE